MDLPIALIASAVGYLLGSLSFARVVTRIFAPELDLKGIEFQIHDSDETFQVEAIAGTAVASQLGDKYGGLTAILDILKVMVPTLVIRGLYPATSYYLITAAAGLIGHNWPIYHRFKGGRGMSAIYGGFFAIDWIGAFVTAILALILGVAVLKSVLVAYTAGMWLMIPWVWFRTHDLARVAYVIFVNVVYWIAMIPEIKMMREVRRRGTENNFANSMDATPMGRGLRKMARRLGLSADEQ